MDRETESEREREGSHDPIFCVKWRSSKVHFQLIILQREGGPGCPQTYQCVKEPFEVSTTSIFKLVCYYCCHCDNTVTIL